MPSKHLRGAASPRTVWTALALSAASPAATAGERLDLSSGWPAGLRWIGPKEGVAIGGLAGSLTALLLFLKAPDRPHWDSAVLFDDGVRNALRASSPEGRSRAGTISDVAFVLAAYRSSSMHERLGAGNGGLVGRGWTVDELLDALLGPKAWGDDQV